MTSTMQELASASARVPYKAKTTASLPPAEVEGESKDKGDLAARTIDSENDSETR